MIRTFSLIAAMKIATPTFAALDLVTNGHAVAINGKISGVIATLNPQPPLSYSLNPPFTQIDLSVRDANFPWQDYSWFEGKGGDGWSQAETKVKSSSYFSAPGDSQGRAEGRGNSIATSNGASTVAISYGVNTPDMWNRPQSANANGSRCRTDILLNTIVNTLRQHQGSGHNQWKAVLKIGNTTYAPIWGPYSQNPNWGNQVNIPAGNLNTGNIVGHQANADLHTKFQPSKWSIMHKTATSN